MAGDPRSGRQRQERVKLQAPGQLHAEMQANGWLSVAADDEIVFMSDHDGKWHKALAKLHIDGPGHESCQSAK